MLIQMPNGNTPMQPYPYKNTGDGTSQGVLSNLLITDTTLSTGFANDTGSLIVRGGAQFQNDIWVNGNIYVAGRIYQSSFVPTIAATSGTIGTISYTKRTGNYTVATDNSCVFYTVSIAGSYTGASTATLEFSGLPNVSATTIGVNTNVSITINNFVYAEVGAQMQPSSLTVQFVYISTSGSPTINGDGTFAVIASGCYATSAAGSFTPTITGTGTLGTLTYNTQTGAYGTIGSTTAYQSNLNISTTGTTLSVLNIAGFPSVVNTISSTNSALLPMENVAGPAVLRFNPAGNTATMYNTASLLNTTVSTSSDMDIKASGYYIATGISTTFVPVLGGDNVGTITYSEQTSRYETTGQCTIFTINMVGTYSGASCSQVKITGFTKTNGTTECITKQLFTDLGGPLTATFGRNVDYMTLAYTANGDALQLIGSGSFIFRCTGFLIAVS